MTIYTSITIPASVTTINGIYSGNIIRKCPKLTSIIVESKITKYDPRDNCNVIVETISNRIVTPYKETTFPTSITGIAEYAFFACSGLESIVIPNTITFIGQYAFHSCRDLKYVKKL